MKKLILIIIIVSLAVVVVICVLAWPPRGCAEPNYIGMTRDQIVAESASYQRFLDGQIMIMVGSVFHYFKTVDDIRKDGQVMSAPQWGINFRKGIIKTYYFEVYFEKGVVVKQTKSWYANK